ncbi:MAG TPA: hypothetical protein VNW68_05100, partial [Candidatus Limnocylindria bacterium]|nr:hypothetical protein [Candidatus Limnocylindria bacterium]
MQQQLRTVDEVARVTHQPARRLRDWCATGQLACEPVGRSWEMPESEIPRALGLAAQPGRLPRGRCAVALALPAGALRNGVSSDIAKRLGLSESELSVACLAIDGSERALVVWPRASQTTAVEALAALADELGGE